MKPYAPYLHEILPDRLESKGLIVSATGTVGTVVRTRQKNLTGEWYYRLRYALYGVLSSRLWTRDELQQAGCRYIYRKDADESNAVAYANAGR
jgi:hypothetical protein